MRLLTQNVLNYPELLESSRRSKERLLLCVISVDNIMITIWGRGAIPAALFPLTYSREESIICYTNHTLEAI